MNGKPEYCAVCLLFCRNCWGRVGLFLCGLVCTSSPLGPELFIPVASVLFTRIDCFMLIRSFILHRTLRFCSCSFSASPVIRLLFIAMLSFSFYIWLVSLFLLVSFSIFPVLFFC